MSHQGTKALRALAGRFDSRNQWFAGSVLELAAEASSFHLYATNHPTSRVACETPQVSDPPDGQRPNSIVELSSKPPKYIEWRASALPDCSPSPLQKLTKRRRTVHEEEARQHESLCLHSGRFAHSLSLCGRLTLHSTPKFSPTARAPFRRVLSTCRLSKILSVLHETSMLVGGRSSTGLTQIAPLPSSAVIYGFCCLSTASPLLSPSNKDKQPTVNTRPDLGELVDAHPLQKLGVFVARFNRNVSRHNTDEWDLIINLKVEFDTYTQDWCIEVNNTSKGCYPGTKADAAAMSVTVSYKILIEILTKKIDPYSCYLFGKLRVRGNMRKVEHIPKLLNMLTEEHFS